MRLRALLFVPGDRPDRMAKALQSGSDAVILDLEDSVAPSAKEEAREAVAALLARPRWDGPLLFVRVNALDTSWTQSDIAAVGPCHPDGIVLPKADGPESLVLLDQLLKQSGDRDAVALPISTETAGSIFRLPAYAGAPRLAGLTWGAEDLYVSIGAAGARDDDGRFIAPIELARSLTIFAARAANVLAIETVYPNFSDLDGLARMAATAARDGFSGMLAIHPKQVPIIQAAFTPSQDAVRAARDIVAAFDAHPEAGVLSVAGKMIDAPHLKRAQDILSRA